MPRRTHITSRRAAILLLPLAALVAAVMAILPSQADAGIKRTTGQPAFCAKDLLCLYDDVGMDPSAPMTAVPVGKSWDGRENLGRWHDLSSSWVNNSPRQLCAFNGVWRGGKRDLDLLWTMKPHSDDNWVGGEDNDKIDVITTCNSL